MLAQQPAAMSYGRGFTLIELMISVAIVGVLSTLALPEFNQWIANTKIRSTTESILAGFQFARAEAIRRNKGVQIQLNGDTGWSVTEVASGTELQARPATEGSGGIRLAILLSDATSPASGTVVFNGLGRVANTTPITQVEVDSTVINAASTRELRITINAGGRVRACDPSKPASDPRGC